MAPWRLQMPLWAYSCRRRQEFNAFLLMSALQNIITTDTPLQAELSSCCCSPPPVEWESGKKHGISCRGTKDCACPGSCKCIKFSYNLDPYVWSRVIWQEHHTRNKEPNLSSAEKATVPDWHHTINQLGILSPSTSRAWNPGELFFNLFWGFFL